MATTPYVRFYWSDWIADTSHLDLMQLGAYMRLLEHVYQHGRPLPGDIQRVFRICHATSTTEQETIRSILSEYFMPFEDPENGLQWRHLRAEREMEWSKNAHGTRVEKASRAARARWEKPDDNAPSNAPSISQAMLKQCSSNANQNQNQNQKEEQPPPTDDSFAKFWSSYPRKQAKAEAAKVWKSQKLAQLADMIVADVTRRRIDDCQWRDPQYIPHPTTYLRQRRWEDEIQTATPETTKRPYTRDQWERFGRERGIIARPGETWDEYLTRIQGARNTA